MLSRGQRKFGPGQLTVQALRTGRPASSGERVVLLGTETVLLKAEILGPWRSHSQNEFRMLMFEFKSRVKLFSILRSNY